MPLYLDAIKGLLPQEYASRIGSLDTATVTLLDALVRFSTGGDTPSDASSSTRTQWAKQQLLVPAALDKVKSATNHKRAREDDTSDEPEAKKSKPSSLGDPEDKPLYTLHSISVSSPIRKKVDITLFQSSIRFTNPTTNATEHSIPLSHLKRVFLLPTRGKTKPHWTVLIMSSDAPLPTGKGAAAASSSSKEDQPQIVFGIDAAPPSFQTTNHAASSEPASHAKGTPILPSLRAFLSHLPFRTLEPSISVFRSALSTGEGSAGVTGYRGNKEGSLWFLSEGILWDGKPCEFWPLSALVGGRRNGKGRIDVDLGGAEGVRTVSATGRTCTVIVSRKLAGPAVKDAADRDDGEDEEDEEEQSVDTDVNMVDGKEQEGISRWVKKHRHLFGVAPVENDAAGDASKAPANEEDSDEDDSDFEGDTSSDGGSPTSSSDEGGDEGGEGGDDDDDDAKSEDLGSGSERSEEGEDEDEPEELDLAHHPLLRPGAMPRMSRAVIDAVVGMVQDDLMSGTTNLERRGANDTGESGDDEEDELED